MIKDIKLLDCTLRDGGYVNNWCFGKDAILDIKNKLDEANIDIIELGFLKNEQYLENRTVFNNIEQLKKIIGIKKNNTLYAVMTEVVNPLPLEKISYFDDACPDIIRVIVWKSMLQEGFEYCRGIAEKGYKLCVQPARVSQYSDQEFLDMLKLFSKLDPFAIYIVDSWGTLYKNDFLHYLKLADNSLKSSVAIGYHGHNNLMQAFELASSFVEQNINRNIIIDTSVFGIGRGAGNLNSEIFAKWMNERKLKHYDCNSFIYIYDKYISEIYKKEKWGFSIPYFITAKYNCNPNYGSYYQKKGFTGIEIEKFISRLSSRDRIIFSPENANKAII